MKTAFRNLRLALALCVCAPGALHAAAYTWTGGTSSDWDNASNWSGGVVPAFSNTTDTVTINVRSGPVLTSLTATTAAFTIGGAANTTGSLALINSSLYSVSINSGGNATGTAFITLDNSTWYVPNNLFLGGNGHAVVELHGNSAITNAGPVSTTGNVGLAQNAGAVGILTLNDNSVWQSANILYVGFRSSGTLHMNDNSKAVSRTNFYIGGNGATTARGWVDMSGAARITVGGFAEIGSTGIGALIMSGNSLLNISGTANTLIGASAGAEGAVTLSDNAVFRTAWDLLVGAAGDGRITFLNGGFVQANASVITLSASSASSHGTIEIAGNGAHSITRIDGTTPVGINGGAGTAKMRFAHSNPGLVFGNPLTGSLAVEVDGPGLTTLTGENTYTGGNIVRSGTLAGTTSSIRGDILADGAVILATPTAHTLKLTGAGAFSKLGGGALTLAPASNFAGSAFNLAAGSVAFDGAATLDNTLAVTLASGGTLAGSLARTTGQSLSAAGGAITGNVSLANATLLLEPASAGAAPFAIGGDLAFADSILKLGLFAGNDGIINIGGAINISGANSIDLTLGMSGTYTLAGFGALAGGTITADGLPLYGGPGSRQSATTAASGADLLILVDSDISRRLAWTGAASINWDGADANWIGSNSTNNYAALDTVVFDGVADDASPANRDITLAGNLRVSDMIVSGDADYTFAGAGGVTSGTLIITRPGDPENLTGVTGKLLKTGAGALRFENTGANNFAGGIEISGGVIAFDNAAQLGTAAASGAHGAILFTGAGGTLAGTLAGGGAVAGTVGIAATATATFEVNGGALALTGGVSGAGALEKTGDGTLEISGSATHTGLITVTGGTLSAVAASLRGATIANDSALALRADTAGAWSGNVTGTGAFHKTGAGALEITGAMTPGTVNVSQGALVITPAARFAAATLFNIAPGAALAGTGSFSAPRLVNAGAIRVGRAANPAAPHGTMTFNGDYTSAGSGEIRLDMSLNARGVMDYDRFIINGNADGVTNVSLQEKPSAASLHGDTSLLPALGDMLVVSGSAADGAFVSNGIVEFAGGQYRWDPALNAGAGGWQTLVTEPVSAIAALDAAAMFIGKASIASLEERLLGVRAMYMKVSREKQFWVTGYYRDEQLAGLRYDRHTTAPRIDIGTMGVQAGVDWVAAPDPSFIFIYGISADYAISDIRLPGGRTNTTTGDTASMGAGVYGSLVSGPWHIDALLRYGAQDYEATAARVAPISTSSQSWSGMISVGRDIPLGKAAKWKLEPAARFVYQRNNNFTDVTDSAGRLYTTSGIFSNELRASIRLSRDGAWKKNLRCAPYVRAGCTYDFATDGRITVAGEDFDHGFSGAGMEAGGGLLLEVRNDILLQAAFSWFDTDVSRGIAATAGISFTW